MAYEFSRVQQVDWDKLDRYPDRTLFQTKPWLDFVAEAQHAEPVVARISDSGQTVGYFTGAIVRKFGMKILGSPFPGWTTSYMGFNLMEGVVRSELLPVLRAFAFHELGCAQVECMDRRISISEAERMKWNFRRFNNFEIDLTPDMDTVLSRMRGTCRWSIRKAERLGVRIEVAADAGFTDDYYDQLVDVFAKQSMRPPYMPERVRLLIKHILPTGNLLLLRARDEKGQCVATGIFPAYRQVMYFWGGASYRRFQFLQPNELIQLAAMQFWAGRGVTLCDMGGGGEYKRKYGGREIEVPFLRCSRYPFLETARRLALAFQRRRQRLTA